MMMNQKGRRRMRTIDEGGEDIVAVPQQPTSTVVVNIISNTVHDKYVVVSAHV